MKKKEEESGHCNTRKKLLEYWNIEGIIKTYLLIKIAECLKRFVIINPGWTAFAVMFTPSSCVLQHRRKRRQNSLRICNRIQSHNLLIDNSHSIARTMYIWSDQICLL